MFRSETFAILPTNAIDLADLNQPIDMYSNTKVYSVGDIIQMNGAIYKMVQGIGAAGYSPERAGDQSWSKIKSYDNSVVYSPGAIVSLNGKIYKMVQGIGASGYSPERVGDQSWQQVATSSKLGNTFKYRQAWYE